MFLLISGPYPLTTGLDFTDIFRADEIGSWDSAVGITTGYALDGQGVGI
jgi:hypothetical protein